MSESIAVNQVGRKQAVFVELDRSKYTFTPAKKSGYQLISVALPSGQTNADHVEIYSTGVKVRLVSQTNKQNVVRFETCIPVPPGSPGPTFPGPECPQKWPFSGWPIPTPPGAGDLFLIRVVGRGIKTRAASIANTEQLLQFLNEVASEVEKRVGTETLQELKSLTMLNQKLQRDASFRGQLQNALLEAGVPATQKARQARNARESQDLADKVGESNKTDKIGNLANAACATASTLGPLAAAAACGFALGWAIGDLIWG